MEIISERVNDVFVESIVHAGQETIKVLPFMFAAFVIMELMEHRTVKIKPTGYFIGALAGCIPQCGFAAAAANLWAGRRISTGLLIAVFVSTSDEALLLLLSDPVHIKEVGYILLIKITVSIAVGYAVDHTAAAGGISISRGVTDENNSHHLCCAGTPSAIVVTAAGHTFRILIMILIFSAAVDIIVHMAGKELLSSIMMSGTFVQPLIAAAVGLVPSCVPSVLITQLYIEGLLSFPALMAGLTANAGIGLLITRSLPITVILFISAITSAAVIQGLMWIL